MSVTCPVCGFDENPADADFCEACGSELARTVPSPPVESPLSPAPHLEPDPDPDPEPSFTPPPAPHPEPVPARSEPEPEPAPTIASSPAEPAASTARLAAVQANAPTAEFALDGSSALVGRFDPDTGPVDIDLEGFAGDDTISRNHAEIYAENGQWFIKDLGSTNGVFLRRTNESRFSARITRPEPLHSGDEIAIAKIRFRFQSP